MRHYATITLVCALGMACGAATPTKPTGIPFGYTEPVERTGFCVDATDAQLNAAYPGVQETLEDAVDFWDVPVYYGACPWKFKLGHIEDTPKPFAVTSPASGTITVNTARLPEVIDGSPSTCEARQGKITLLHLLVHELGHVFLAGGDLNHEHPAMTRETGCYQLDDVRMPSETNIRTPYRR